MGLLLDLTPLRVSPDFRRLWSGQAISFVGSTITTAALPYQVFHQTGSSAAVGLLGAVQLVPLLLCSLMGGALADSLDKRRLLLAVSVAQLVCSLALAANASLGHPQLWLLYLLGAVSSAGFALSYPVVRSLLPLLLDAPLRPAAFALQSTYGSFGMMAGPALAGVLIGAFGLATAYGFDVATYVVAVVAFTGISPAPPPVAAGRASPASIVEGLRFLRGRPVIVSVFAIDLLAMVFGMPRALFPALAERLGGGAPTYGLLLSSVAAGALVMSLLSGWTARVERHGRTVVVCVAAWGAAIAVVGLTRNLVVVMAMLVCAGGADMVSGIFRSTIAADITPDDMRGRVSGVEIAVYAGGPVLGDVEAGLVGGAFGLPFAIVSGGVACVLGAAGFAIGARLSARPLDYRSGSSVMRAARGTVDFDIPPDIQATLDALDAFIEREIEPLEAEDDNVRFFDHRREFARTDFEADGIPRADWEDLLAEMRRRADAAGWLRWALPAEHGGHDASNLEMAIIREHLAARGLGLHNDLQNESSIVGNFPTVLMMRDFGTEEQRAEWMPGFLDGSRRLAFGLTEPAHGSDATYLETTAVADGDEWVLNGQKRFNSGLHRATHDIVFARSSGDPGSPVGITAFLVPTDAPGFSVDFYWWTFNMPTDHAEVTLHDVRVPASAVFGRVDHGLELAQHFVHENRIRQAASSLGAAQYCINEAVAYANQRITWGQPLSRNQGIQFPLIELHTEAAMLRELIRRTAEALDRSHHMEVTHLVAMCNYRANRLACDAADRAMQTCGGVGYSRHMPFEHIYRHHRRYRITEGSEEIQMRKVGQQLFGFGRNRGGQP